jgi:GT2 family glycosyltransferase
MTSVPRKTVPFGAAVLNWNQPELTIACLDSLLEADPRPAHVVVIDNRSKDSSLQRMLAWAGRAGMPYQMVATDTRDAPAPNSSPAWLTIVASSTNRGFAGGNNVALRYLAKWTPVTHFLLLNNDATVASDFFAEIQRALRTNPDAGLLTGTILEDEPGDKVWYAGAKENRLRALISHTFEIPSSDAAVPTPFISGCAMLISRPVLESIGPLAECYDPIYWEDAEYSARAREAGFPVLYAPKAIVRHKVGASVGRLFVSAPTTFWQNRYRAFYVRRNYRGWVKGAALAYLIATKPARAVVETLRGRPKIGWAILRGVTTGIFSPAARR